MSHWRSVGGRGSMAPVNCSMKDIDWVGGEGASCVRYRRATLSDLDSSFSRPEISNIERVFLRIYVPELPPLTVPT